MPDHVSIAGKWDDTFDNFLERERGDINANPHIHTFLLEIACGGTAFAIGAKACSPLLVFAIVTAKLTRAPSSSPRRNATKSGLAEIEKKCFRAE